MIRKLSLLFLSVFLIATACQSDQKTGKETFDSELKGAVSYREKKVIPPSSIISVRLLDITNNKAKVVSETRITAGDKSIPFLFSLGYNKSDIKEDKTYGLEAEISDAGILIFSSSKPVEVLSNNLKNNVTLMLQSDSKN